MSAPQMAGMKPDKLQFIQDTADQEPQLDIVEYLRTLRKRKWSILFFAVLVALVAGVVAYVSTPIYEAKTTLLIETNKQKLVTIEDVYSGVGSSREYFQTQIEIIKSREVALKVIATLKLYDNPYYDPRQPNVGIADFIKKKIGIASREPPKEWTKQALTEAVYGSFVSNLVVEPIRQSNLLIFRFTSPSPDLAALVANTLVKTYIESDMDARYEMTRTASVWLLEQLSVLKEKLNQSERVLQNYREKIGVVNVDKSTQSNNGPQIEQLQSRLIEARSRRAEAEATYKIIKDAANLGNLASQPAVLNSALVLEAKRQSSDAARKLAEASQRYGKDHPKFAQVESEAKASEENLKQQIDLVVGSVNQEYERARGTEKTLESALAAARGSVQVINRKEFELGQYEREVESNRQMYDMFIKRSKETSVASDLQTSVARVVDAAVVPGSPIKPQKQRIIQIAFFIGLVLGSMLALLMDALDNTIKRTEDIETRLKQPLLTVLPLLNMSDSKRDVSAHLVIEAPNSLYSESVRTARTGVLLSSVDLASRVLVVTSSVPGEGKSTFASNLALAHAFTQKTVLVDADMRRPSLAKSHGLDANTVGLSELVAGSAKLSDCLQQVKNSNLMVIGSGSIPPNPLELLLSVRFTQTLEELSRTFEMVILDSPPVDLVSDALVLASRGSGVIFVTKAQTTPVPMVRKAIRRIRRAEGNIMGVVLNALDFSKAEKYYGEYSGYSKYGYKIYGSAYGHAYGSSGQAAKKEA